jgi:hypothetical protein
VGRGGGAQRLTHALGFEQRCALQEGKKELERELGSTASIKHIDAETLRLAQLPQEKDDSGTEEKQEASQRQRLYASCLGPACAEA